MVSLRFAAMSPRLFVSLCRNSSTPHFPFVVSLRADTLRLSSLSSFRIKIRVRPATPAAHG